MFLADVRQTGRRRDGLSRNERVVRKLYVDIDLFVVARLFVESGSVAAELKRHQTII